VGIIAEVKLSPMSHLPVARRLPSGVAHGRDCWGLKRLLSGKETTTKQQALMATLALRLLQRVSIGYTTRPLRVLYSEVRRPKGRSLTSIDE